MNATIKRLGVGLYELTLTPAHGIGASSAMTYPSRRAALAAIKRMVQP